MLNVCEGCSVDVEKDESFRYVVEKQLGPNKAMLDQNVEDEINCNIIDRAYPHGSKCKVTCQPGYAPLPKRDSGNESQEMEGQNQLRKTDQNSSGAKYFKCICKKGNCSWKYGGGYDKLDQFGNEISKDRKNEWVKYDKTLACYDLNDTNIFGDLYAAKLEKLARQENREERISEREIKKEENFNKREITKAENRVKFETKRLEKLNPITVTMMHAFKVPTTFTTVHDFNKHYIQKQLGFKNIFGLTNIYVISGYPAKDFEKLEQFLKTLVVYLKSKAVPISYFTTVGTGLSAETAKLTVFLYNPLVVRISKSFPDLDAEAQPQAETDDFTHLPTGAMFERVDRKTGWVRRFTILAYEPPLDTAIVKIEVPKLGNFLTQNTQTFGNNTMIIGDFRLNCLDYHYNYPPATGLSGAESIPIIQNLSSTTRWVPYNQKVKQPGMKRKRFCANFGAFVVNSRKGGDVCVDERVINWGRQSQNILGQLGMNMYPLECRVN